MELPIGTSSLREEEKDIDILKTEEIDMIYLFPESIDMFIEALTGQSQPSWN